jgi:hypothetical protein
MGEQIILRWILKREHGLEWTRLIWLRIGTSGICEDGDEISVSVKCWEILQ